MVQSVRQEEPQYVCVVPVETVTGHQDEEIMTFGVSVDEAISKAEQLLTETYGCNRDAIYKLMKQAQVEPLSQWCSPSHNQG
ncbi:MAG: hypothetical protein JOZ78_01710 [Chroococcidiopsidaceae cyanobacterium CP_BM_ER_R8_30]|nr:hypothetical protein [Chroococcidiopsidaceae cyanobacterium CP_BM_ER_R8_30]